MRPALAFAAVLALAGCGKDAPSRDDPQRTVSRFVHAVQTGDLATACDQLDAGAADQIRLDVLATFRPTATAVPDRLRQVRRAHRRARTCQGALGLAVSAMGPRLDGVARDVARARVRRIGRGAEVAAAGSDGWDLAVDDGRWRIYGANAFVDALPDG